jgi:hypothetical protein
MPIVQRVLVIGCLLIHRHDDGLGSRGLRGVDLFARGFKILARIKLEP